MYDTDVLIVGAGPTGLTLSCELRRHGVEHRLIDKASAPSDKSKAFGVHARTMEILDNMGAIEPLLAKGRPCEALGFYDRGARVAHIDMRGKIDSKYPFILIAAQSDTERVLIEHLQGLGGAVEREVELRRLTRDGDGVRAELARAGGAVEVVRCRYLVAADGAHSTVRHALDIAFEGAPYPTQWLLADLHIDWDLPPDELAVFPHRDGAVAYFPLAAQRGRLMFELPRSSIDEDLGEPTLDDVSALAAARDLGVRGLRDPTWLAYFRLHHRVAERYREGRVFLAGDAAHIHSPVGGQGMNIGMQDAYNLAWKLALVVHGHASDGLLESYGVERRRVDQGVVALTHRATQMVTLRNPVLQAIRNAVVRLASKLDAVQSRMLATLSQVEHHYRDSPVVAEAWSPGGRVEGFTPAADELVPGERVGDYALTRADTGAAVTLYELFSGAEHELLLFAGVRPTAEELGRLDEIARAVAERGGAPIEVHLIRGPEPAAGETPGGWPAGLGAIASTHVDDGFRVHSAFGAGRASLYLVRPDGYVGFRCQPAGREALEGYLARVLSA